MNVCRVISQPGVCVACLLALIPRPDASQAQSLDAEPVTFIESVDWFDAALANSAACCVDVNGDGWTDICAGNLFLNEGGERFQSTGSDLGSVVAGDFDNDGFPDLFSWSQLRLYRNLAGEAFEEFPLPELPATTSRGACWGDFNGDSFLDLYIGGYEDWNAGLTFPDLLLLNQSGRSFELFWQDERFRTRGVTACDFDNDHDLDVYASNYRLQPNVLWQNDGQANLIDQTRPLGCIGTSEGFAGGHTIGSAWGDFNNDGLFDLFVGNFAHVDNRGDQPKSRFLANLGSAADYSFEDRGPCGIHYQESYASPAAADYDNDGRLDFFFTTVYGTASFGRANHPTLFRAEDEFSFRDVNEQVGLSGLPPTYQAAWLDADNDGDLDLLTAGKLYLNSVVGTHWIRFRLIGNGIDTNRSAIGAQVRIVTEAGTLSRQVSAGTGEGNQNDLSLHFGLNAKIESVACEVTWPNGTVQQLENLPPQQIVEILQPQ